MKLRVILLFAVVLFSVRQVSASPVNRTVKTVSVASFQQIEINAQVLVLLETGLKSGVRIEGDPIAVAQTSFTVRNGVLQVNNPRQYEKTKRPVVYIQTGLLKELFINSESQVVSVKPLKGDRLNVHINAHCRVSLQSEGKLEFIPEEAYDFDYIYRNPAPRVYVEKEEN